MKFKNYISILLLLLVSSFTMAQVTFEAKVSKKKLGVNERLRIDFTMNEDGDNFNPPSFSDFTVVAGPSQSVSNSWINGVRTYKKTYTYFLAPKKRGTFTIAQASITIDGETYKTVPVKIEVTEAVEVPKDPNDPNYVASESIHLVAEISKPNPYLNEAISVVYKLYVAPNIRIQTPGTIDIPTFKDFWNQNIEIKELRLEQGSYKGEDYSYVVMMKQLLIPQKTGELKIPALVLDVPVQVPTNRRDIFGSRIMTRVNKRVSSGIRTINVKALPETGKPVDFTGAVGRNFKLNVTSSKTKLDASESLQVKVSVKGNGNLKLFKLPKISLPSSLEVYEPEHSEQIRTNLSGMQGSILDSYTVVPQFKGKYPIPSISFSYFDLDTKTYKRLSSEEIVIDVVNGPSSSTPTSENNTIANNKQVVVLNSNQFAFIKTKTSFSSIGKTHFFKTKAFWSLLLLPFLAIPLAIVIRSKKASRDADVYGNRIRKADKLAKKYLKGAKKSLGQKEAFYIALEKALHNYLKAKLLIETSDFSKEKITNLLKEKQVEESTVNNFISIIENCELARYTPIDTVTMNEDYEKAAKTISLIDKQAR